LCAAKCPVKTIRLIPYLGNLGIPEVIEDKCTGCGACEHVCPVRPDRAIIIEPLAVHQIITGSSIQGVRME
jgi:ferredoxin